jgi:bis(5'-nucleosyl)-tetraphosphatase (symmetrical)
MRWLIGDVQGCARELDDLLAAIRYDPAADEVWFAGDLINRGPHSLETLRLFRQLGGLGVLGNHDLYALRVRSGEWQRKKSDTLGELFSAPDADELLDQLAMLPILTRLKSKGDGPDCWLVHAGVSPRWKNLEKTADKLNAHAERLKDSPELRFATTARCCHPDGKLCPHKGPPEDCKAPCQPWDVYYQGPDLVVHGHWAWRRHYRGKHTLGLDDSCVHGGHLVAWCQDEDRIVRVPSRQ